MDGPTGTVYEPQKNCGMKYECSTADQSRNLENQRLQETLLPQVGA